MTITFQGHVSKIETKTPKHVAVTLQTPMDPAGGVEMVVRVPAEEAVHWLPGRMVSFTIYTLPAQAEKKEM